MDSTHIRLYPLEADHGFLALSTSPTNEPTALHLGGCMVGALEELEDEGVSFEEWLEESFYTCKSTDSTSPPSALQIWQTWTPPTHPESRRWSMKPMRQ